MANYTVFGPFGRFGAEPSYFTRPGSLPELSHWKLYDLDRGDHVRGPKTYVGNAVYFLDVCEKAAKILASEGRTMRDINLTREGVRFLGDE